jgi:hypothetical protein
VNADLHPERRITPSERIAAFLLGVVLIGGVAAVILFGR